ncbi:serine carboxypeptidase-like 13 [Rutidosis leptorrhynchoides]|uniref:serine carboxypeptidase-like 13 n=1 Tax=Rutidosis leptorrhynchoides TaxID=125765 RepID=UPI003A992FE6
MRMVLKHKSLILWLAYVLIVQSYLLISHSKSIIKRLPGYHGDLHFKLETGYVGVGDKEEVQLFYYFVESTNNSEEDPLIFYIPGGPGASALVTFFLEIGPVSSTSDDNNNLTLALNQYAWTQMANIIFIDIPAGTGFSYSETKQGWISSDTNLAILATDFIKKFLTEHPKFKKNPLYIAGISYIGIIVPKITLDLYESNERGDQPTLNIQGYILCSPFTNKFEDFNSRFKYAHRNALISDDIYMSAIKNCQGNFVSTYSANSFCASSLQMYEECTSRINLDNILEPFCDENDPIQDCDNDSYIETWANTDIVQQALHVRQGKVGKWELINQTLHYNQGKNDTFCYSYDIFSSYSYHKKLSTKNCRALIFSGDQDMTFPYVGVEEWITALNVGVEVPWKPFYVDGQVGGYQTKYAENEYSLTFATVKGAGHLVPLTKPKESIALVQRWFNSQPYVSDY